jgi:Flp pilus assembly pilin Flp
VKGGGSHHTIVRRAAAEQGQAAVEYAVILGLVTALLIAGYQVLGETAAALYERVVTAFT